jgi:hypothetical protein
LGLIPYNDWVLVKWEDGANQKERLVQFGANSGDVTLPGTSLTNIQVIPIELPPLALNEDYEVDTRTGWVISVPNTRIQDSEEIAISYSVGGKLQFLGNEDISFASQQEAELSNVPIWDLKVDGSPHPFADHREGIIRQGFLSATDYNAEYKYSALSTYTTAYDYELTFDSPEINTTPYSSVWQAIESAQSLAESIFLANEIELPTLPLTREWQWLTELLIPIVRYFLLEQPYEIDVEKYKEAKARLERSIRKSTRSQRKGTIRKPEKVDFGYYWRRSSSYPFNR